MKRPDPSRRKTKKRKIGAVKRKSTRGRRRKMGGVKTDIMDQVYKAVALGGGALLGRELNSVVTSTIDPSLDPTISGVIQAAIGFAIPLIFPGEEIVDFIGYGMVAQGLMVAAVSQIGVLQGPNGPGRVSYVYRKVNGGNFNTIAGPRMSKMSLIAGTNFNTLAGAPTARLNGMRKRKSVVCPV